MNIVRKISVIVAAAICIAVTACSVKTVEVPFDPNVEDYTPIVVEILKSHPEGNLKIRFGKGLYPFYPEQGAREFLTLSNNDSGDKRIAFLIKDMRNVTIEGNGSDFMFHGCMVPFAVKGSSNVTIKGVSVDYDYPWTFEGRFSPAIRSAEASLSRSSRTPSTALKATGFSSEAMTGSIRWGRASFSTRRPTGRSSTHALTTTAIGLARWEPGR